MSGERFLAAIAVAVAPGLAVYSQAQAQGYPPGYDIPIYSSKPESGDSPSEISFISENHTNTIVRELERASDTCSQHDLRREYVIDCLRVEYERVASLLPRRGEYEPVRQALLTAAERLDSIVTQSLDTEAPSVRVPQGGRPRAPRTGRIRAVQPERADAAIAAAEDIIAEAELVILRSGETPPRRAAHYSRIATAVNENLLVLRSA